MAKAFAFKLRDRVMVPAHPGVQGVVVAREESVRGHPRYYVETLTGAGVPSGGWVEHDDLVLVNPPALPTKKNKR